MLDYAEKLEILRQELINSDCDAYLQFHHDMYGNEELMPADRMLHFLTRFSGSEGAIVLTNKKAAIFVDGRYTVQVKQEVDNKLYEYQDLTFGFPNIICWIKANLTEGKKIAFDPNLLPHNKFKELEKQLVDYQLVAINENLIAKIWIDRPNYELKPFFNFSLEQAGKTTSKKLEDIKNVLIEKQVDYLFVNDSASIAWLLNIRGNDIPNTPVTLSLMLIKQNGEIIWFVNKEQIDNNLDLETKLKILDINKIENYFVNNCDKAKIIFSSDVPQKFINLAKTIQIEIIIDENPLLLMKAVKNFVELKQMAYSSKIDSIAWIKFLAWLDNEIANDNSLTEIQCVKQILSFRKQIPEFFSNSFDVISGFGPNGAICHYHVTEQSSKTFTKDNLYLIDSGGHYTNGGSTDSTRTIVIGQATIEMKTRFTQVLKGMIAVSQAKFTNKTTGSHLDFLARQFLYQDKQNFTHGTGHGVGCFLEVHESPPNIGNQLNEFKPNMIVSNEPGFYKEGKYGIRIENLLYVLDLGDNFLGFETLTLIPIDLRLIDKKLMTAQEIKWLNDYHKLVKNELIPLIDDEYTKKWLINATKAI